MSKNKVQSDPQNLKEARHHAVQNGGNAGASRNFDEQHGIRGSQLNANTTANTGKSKHRGA